MKLITQRDLIRDVSAAWDDQYKHWFADAENMAISERLAALDLEVATAGDVAEIIGNTSWTRLKCHECGNEDINAVIQVGQEPDYESCTAGLCFDCVAKAADMAHNACSTPKAGCNTGQGGDKNACKPRQNAAHPSKAD